jgi:putative ubiquitin-RnfH superfamily antitoxin RatB of RatAB toxin-antitoxin module
VQRPPSELPVEVVFALPEEQVLVTLRLEEGTTVEDAVAASGLYERFPRHDLKNFDTGIWGRLVPRTQRLKSGDRVELYRPLRLDPRDARRERASGT